MPVGADCDFCFDPLDPWCHWSPSVSPYEQGNVFHTSKDTVLIVDQSTCGGTASGWGMELKESVSHGKITFNKGRYTFWLYDGSFTYTPDPGFTGWDEFEYGCLYDHSEYGDCHSDSTAVARIYVGDGQPIPEFPSAFLPATMIIGFLGAVLFIQVTKEH